MLLPIQILYITAKNSRAIAESGLFDSLNIIGD